MRLVLRHATDADAEAIATIHATAWQRSYRGIMPDSILDGVTERNNLAGRQRRWEERIAGGGVIAAELEGRLVGFARIVPGSRAESGEITHVFVKPSMVGQGLGRALIDACAKEMAEGRGYRRAELWVLSGNANARAFYEALGWVTAGLTRRRREDGMDLEETQYRRDL